MAATPTSTCWPVIAKDVAAITVTPNLVDYERTYATFTWDDERRTLCGLPDGGVNIAHEAVDRHAKSQLAGRDALRFVRADGGIRSLSCAALADETDRFASLLRMLGVQRGERVFALLGRSPALYTAVLGTLKHGAVFCPLFCAFGPEPVRQRLELGAGSVLVTTRALDRRKVAALRAKLPALRHVLLADGEPEPRDKHGSHRRVGKTNEDSPYKGAGRKSRHGSMRPRIFEDYFSRKPDRDHRIRQPDREAGDTERGTVPGVPLKVPQQDGVTKKRQRRTRTVEAATASSSDRPALALHLR